MRHALLLILPLLMLAGCGDYRYVPTTIKPTYFTGKGDMEVSLNGMYLGELHGAYAITDHIAVSATTAGIAQTNDTTFNYDTAFKVVGYNSSQKNISDNEISLGAFKNFEDGTTLEIYGGMGFAREKYVNSRVDYINPAMNSTTKGKSLNYRRVFIQPAIGKMSNFLDFGYANRFSFIFYENGPGNSVSKDFISESVLFTRFGYKYVKFMIQFGFTLSSSNNRYDYFPFTIGAGLYFQLNKLRKF